MKHMTVVYSIVDEVKFLDEQKRVMDLFAELGDKSWGVTAVSMDHEIRRVELVEEAIDKNDVDIIPAILEHTDIGNVREIDEL